MAITTKGVLDLILYEKGGFDHIRLIQFINQILKKKGIVIIFVYKLIYTFLHFKCRL